MRLSSLTLPLFILAATTVLGQGEVLTPLTSRPVPQALEALRKSDGLNEHFIYLYNGQSLPIFDDFSVDRVRHRWAASDDPDVTLTGTIYELEVAGVSTWDMLFATDTTFRYTTDTVGVDTTWRDALPVVTVTIFDISVYPPTSSDVDAWPAYNIFDTISNPLSDTLDMSNPDLVQDSLLVYEVAADTRTYTNPDNSVVPLVLWQDDDVYINGTYPIDPPTIGVATFDGLSRTGYPYNYAQFTAYGIADHLTSVPIDLEYNVSDSLYLSFFYQPQGLSGDGSPQPTDSLVLEFWSPTAQFWYRIWSTPYVALQPFQQVLIPIKDELFLDDGFQFRFLNYASLSGSFDHWHLDYVRLGTQRTFDDTRIIDVAYVYPESSLLQTYTSVPFSKFAQAPESYMAPSVSAQIRNLDILDKFIEYGMSMQEEAVGSPLEVFDNGLNSSGNASSAFASAHAVGDAPNSFAYDASLSTDAAFWRVKLFLQTDPDLLDYNDTTSFLQEISNYMSYDDGSAEMGYGLNSAGAGLAYRFDLVGGDSLRAVRMYFNPTANDPQSSPNPDEGSFLLTVWSSLSPETIIHQDLTFASPQYRLDGIDQFVEYPMDSTIWVEGTFYVGWVQANNVRMNLGFDRNRNNGNKIFFRTTTAFQQSSQQGSLMMRPVFKAAVDPFADVPDAGSIGLPGQIQLIPNPASDAVLIRCDAAGPGAIVQCMDPTGRLVKQAAWGANRMMDLGEMNAGMYIVRVLDREGNSLGQERLLIQR
jgi:hypothetical protein